MRFARAVFLIAGVYGVTLITPMYFMEARIGRELPPAITHPEYFYGFVGVTLAWQFLFFVLGSDPLRYRPMMLPAIAEKISYGIAVPFLYIQHRIPSIFVVFGCIDCIFALLFVTSYVVTRTKGVRYGEEKRRAARTA
jgi:hypothetical protein